MKKLIPLMMAALLFIGNAFAEYYEPWSYDEPFMEDVWGDQKALYARIFGGANFLQTEKRGLVKIDFDTGFAVAGSIGYIWSHGVRFEAEYAFRRNCVKRVRFYGISYNTCGHYQSSSYMGNALWDIPLCAWGYNLWGIEPTIGAGMGYDIQRLHVNRYHLKKKGFAWQVIAGLGYPIASGTTISVEYIFHKGSFSRIYNQSIGAALRYDFWP